MALRFIARGTPLALALMALASCGGAPPNAAETVSPASHATTEARPKSAVLDSPTKLLRAFHEALVSRNEARVRELMWDGRFEGTLYVDRVIDLLRSGDADNELHATDGVWPQIIARGDAQFAVPSGAQDEKFMSDLAELDPRLAELETTDPAAFKIIEDKRGFLLVVEIEGQYRLIAWEDVDSLADR